MLYDRKGDQHYDMISALHKSIRASDDNAALYWCTRMMVGGEDPRYICRRMVRAASEDIGLADPNAVTVALSALDAVQLVGMPESDCIIAQCAVYLARAPKSQEVWRCLSWKEKLYSKFRLRFRRTGQCSNANETLKDGKDHNQLCHCICGMPQRN